MAVPGAWDWRFWISTWEGSLTEVSPFSRHLEDADLVQRAEAVLFGAQQADIGLRLALEVEDGVDHVLEGFRAGQLPLLGDMADEEHGDAVLLGHVDDLGRHVAQGGDRAAHVGGFLAR